MRLLLITVAVLSTAVPAITVLTSPAMAQVVTTTSTSFINAAGSTVLAVDTFVNGVLATRQTTETSPLGVLTTIRTFGPTGLVQTQYADMMINGQVVVQQALTFDANGLVATSQRSVLTTLVDGTRVWTTAVLTFAGGVFVSGVSSQTPFVLGSLPLARPVVGPLAAEDAAEDAQEHRAEVGHERDNEHHDSDHH